MSAVDELQAAQGAKRDALGALADIDARVSSGDAGVTGSDLMAAQATVTLTERLEAGAAARASAEQEAAAEAAMAAAFAALMAGYETTSTELSKAIDNALTSLSKLLAAASNHQATTRAGCGAAKLNPAGGVPGYGLLQIPPPAKVVDAVIELALKSCGLHPSSSFPHLTIRPIEPFLPAGVSGR